MGDWVEIIVPVGAADVDDVAALIADEIPAAAAGTEQRGDEVVFWVDEADVSQVLVETRNTCAHWAASGWAVDGTKVRTAAAMPEVEWREAWKKYFKVTRITRQFVVVPSWETYEAQPDDVVINLDPGMAFGTGQHASTKLVLEHLQVMADAGAAPTRVLDVGCGSGILTIAAIKRWPNATGVAIDNDPIAVQACAENMLANRVADRIDVMATPIKELIETFPLVLANIQAHVIREIKESLIKRCGGTLILSGLLTPQAQPLADELVAAGMKLVKIRASAADAEWSSVVLEA